MKNFLKQYFSTGNDINENIVMGTIFAIALLISTFLPVVDGEKYYILAGMVAIFYGVGAFKK
jgi:hypothetical protein